MGAFPSIRKTKTQLRDNKKEGKSENFNGERERQGCVTSVLSSHSQTHTHTHTHREWERETHRAFKAQVRDGKEKRKRVRVDEKGKSVCERKI